MTMWRARLLGALALAGTSALLAAAPARAVVASTPSPSFSPPQSGNNLNYRVTWTPPADNLSYVSYITVEVSGTRPDGNAVPNVPGTAACGPWGAPQPAGQNGPAESCGPTFTATYNGTYDAVSHGQGCSYLDPCDPGNPNAPNWGTVNWPTVTVNEPPAKPTGLAASYDNANRQVKLTWHSNSEPDLIDYLVLRQNSPTDTPSVIATVTSLSYVDNNLGNGGDFAYAIVAERAGVGGSLSSDASDPVGESVPPPPTPTTTTAAGPGGGGGSGSNPPPGGTTSTTQKLINPSLKPPSNYTPSKLDLSAFAKALSAAKARSNPSSSGGDNGSVSGESDTYKQSLPYGSASPNTAGEDGSQQADSPPLARASTNAKDNVRTAAAVAGGLLAIVLAMHGMWLRSEVKRAALLEAVEPEGSDPEEFRDFWLRSDDDPLGG